MSRNTLSSIPEDQSALAAAELGLVQRPGDDDLGDRLRDWSQQSAEDRAVACSTLVYEQGLTLWGYSQRMASLAVRDHSPDLNLLGLLATSVAWSLDYRESLIRIALHLDAAERLRLDPQALFERVAVLLSKEAAEGLRAFLLRPPDNRSLKAFFFVAGADKASFHYVWAPPWAERQLVQPIPGHDHLAPRRPWWKFWN